MEHSQKKYYLLNAKAALRVPHTDNLHKFEFDPPREDLCADFLPFQNVYIRVTKDDEWVSIDPLAEWRQIITEKESVALGLCFKHCYGNQCGERASDELQIDWDKVEISVNDNLISGLKQVGGCFILQGEEGVLWNEEVVGSLSSGMKVQNHGDSTLLLSSAFILY